MIKLIALILGLTAAPTERGTSTIFGMPGDRLMGGATRCLRDGAGKLRKVRPTDIGIAHRRLECFTPVVVRNIRTNRAVIAIVVDAGPYGAGTPGRDWYIKRRINEPPPDGGPVLPWRGVADLTPKAAELVGHNGLDRVELFYSRKHIRRRYR